MRAAILVACSLLPVSLSAACVTDEGDGGAAEAADAAPGSLGDDLLVSGTVVREERRTTWNEPFVPDPDAHVRITLSYVPGADASGELIVGVDLPISALPFDFELTGDADAAFARRGDYVVNAIVYNHAGDERRVGDLLSEYYETISGVTTSRQIRVSGVEHCDAPYAGGFCSNTE